MPLHRDRHPHQLPSSQAFSLIPMKILVIGSGAAGLAAAVSAAGAGASVAVATKTTLQACNSAKAQGGIQAALGDEIGRAHV